MKRKGQIIRIKNGKWRVRIQSKRKGQTKNLEGGSDFTTRAEAEKFLDGLIKKVEKARKNPVRSDKTINDLFDAYLDIVKPKIEEQTFRLYNRIIETRLRPIFGGTLIADLEPITLDKFFTDLSQKYAGEYISKIYSQFNAALKKAKLWRWRSDNPLEDISAPNRKRTPKGIAKPKDALSLEELGAFLSCCPTFAAETLWTFFAVTGARPSEVLAARWKDIDFDLKTFNVNQKLVQLKGVSEFQGTLKTDLSRRVIPIADDLIQMLRKLKSEQNVIRLASPVWEDHDLIFCTRYGRPFRLANLGLKCSAIREAAGIEKNITPNGFRHTYASIADDNDLNGKALKEILGHISRDLTERVYTHPSLEKKRRVAEAMSNLIFGVKNGVKNELLDTGTEVASG